MLPCSACILLCGGCTGAASSPACAVDEALTAPEPRLRAVFDFLAAADMHIFTEDVTEDGLPKLRFLLELLEDVYAVSVLLRVLL